MDNNNKKLRINWFLALMIAVIIILALYFDYVAMLAKAPCLRNILLSQAVTLIVLGITITLIARLLRTKEKNLADSQLQLHHSELIFRQFAEHIDVVFYTTAPDLSKILYASPAYEKIWGKSTEYLYKNPLDWYDSILPEDKSTAYQAFFLGLKKGNTDASAEFRIKRPDGSIRHVLVRIYQLKDKHNDVFILVGIAVDLTQVTLETRYKQIQTNLLNLIESERNIKEFFDKTLKMIACSLDLQLGGLWLIDESKNILRCVDMWYLESRALSNFAVESFRHTFQKGEGFLGRTWETMSPFFIANYADNPAYSRSVAAKIAGLNHAFGVPIIYQGNIFGVMEFFSTDIRQAEKGLLALMEHISKSIGEYIIHTKALEQIQNASRHDFLTGLLNRPTLEADIDQIIVSKQLKSMAVMVCDIDRFQLVNEALGHAFGDKLLKAVAIRLSELIRRDRIGIARLGADKYILYIADISRQSALDYAQIIQHKLSESFEIDKDTINLSVCIGIATYPQDGLDGKSLVINADLAMRIGKEKGGNRVHFFTKDLPLFASKAISMEGDLRAAMLNTDQFILEYQPQVDLNSGAIIAAEVLVRWMHPSRGLIYPGEFIPFAEKNNLIVALNEYVMRMVFDQIHLMKLDIPLSINISAQQFKDGFHFVDYVELLMKEFNISAQQIELEITENMLIEDTEHNLAVLKALSELGFQIAIDDFGTGFSSFNYLNRLPVQKIKIDKSFISGLPTNLANVKIVKAVIALVHSLDMSVLAEGAQTKEEVDFLKQASCDMIQGFYYYKPMSFDKLSTLLVNK